jgi:hypothetical protein
MLGSATDALQTRLWWALWPFHLIIYICIYICSVYTVQYLNNIYIYVMGITVYNGALSHKSSGLLTRRYLIQLRKNTGPFLQLFPSSTLKKGTVETQEPLG